MPVKKIYLSVLIVGLIFSAEGCSLISETVRKMWGSSTEALEKARGEAISKVYHCEFDPCFDAVLKLARKEPIRENAPLALEETGLNHNASNVPATPAEPTTSDPFAQPHQEFDGKFDVFIKDPVKGHIVVMGILGNVNTTEVGIFFTPVSEGVIKIDVSSLSTTAKEKVAGAVFDELDKQFTEVK